MYIHAIKLFAKNQKELETLIQAVRIYRPDIGIKFGVEKCAWLIMKIRKRQITDGNHEKISLLKGKENYKFLGIWEADTITQVEMREKIQKENLRRTTRNKTK